jgi:hypothetical protein
VLRTSAVRPRPRPRRAVCTAFSMLRSPLTQWASVKQTICTPAETATTHILSREIEAVRKPVDLERDALFPPWRKLTFSL